MPAANPLKDYLSEIGWTSDHTEQLVEVQFDNDSNHVVRGMTWNMLNRGFAKKNATGFSNNPFDADESEDEYIERIQEQKRWILAQIDKGALDFCFLQEANWLMKSPPGKLNKASKDRLKKERDDFLNALKTRDWDMMTRDTHDPITAREVATLYDTKKLRLDAVKGTVAIKGKKNCVLYGEFTHLPSGKKTALANCHLEYEADNQLQEVLAVQYYAIQQNMGCIMGGDTNHPQGYDQVGLIGDWNHATNFDYDEDSKKFTIQDDRKHHATTKPFKKRYDGFFVSPTSNTGTAKITEEGGQHFALDAAGKVHAKIMDPATLSHKEHLIDGKRAGHPWIRLAHADEFLSLPKKQHTVMGQTVDVPDITGWNPDPAAKIPTTGGLHERMPPTGKQKESAAHLKEKSAAPTHPPMPDIKIKITRKEHVLPLKPHEAHIYIHKNEIDTVALDSQDDTLLRAAFSAVYGAVSHGIGSPFQIEPEHETPSSVLLSQYMGIICELAGLSVSQTSDRRVLEAVKNSTSKKDVESHLKADKSLDLNRILACRGDSNLIAKARETTIQKHMKKHPADINACQTYLDKMKKSAAPESPTTAPKRRTV